MSMVKRRRKEPRKNEVRLKCLFTQHACPFYNQDTANMPSVQGGNAFTAGQSYLYFPGTDSVASTANKSWGGIGANISQGVAQGTGDSNRLGNSIKLDHVDLRLSFTGNTTFTTTTAAGFQNGSQIRLIVGIDRHFRGASTSSSNMPAQLFIDDLGGATTGLEPATTQGKQARFKIYVDKMIIRPPIIGLSAAGVIGYGATTAVMALKPVFWRKRIDLRGEKMSFTASTDSLGSVDQGALFVCIVETAAGVNPATEKTTVVNGSWRLFFEDNI